METVSIGGSPVGSETINVILFFVALLFSAAFSSSEAAYLSIQRGRLAALSRSDSSKAERINRFASQPEKLLATVLTGNNLANTAAAALGTSIALAFLDGGTAVIASTVVVTIILLVFAEAIPKTFATRYSIGFASVAATPLRFVEALLLPPIWLLERLVRGLTTVLGLPDAPIVSQEELQALVEMGAESGDVQQSQADIMDQVFRMRDRRISDVMTYRTDITAIPQGATVREFLNVYRDSPHSRYPVFKGTIDNILGVVSRHDVLLALANESLGPDDDITGLMRPPKFLPELKPMGDVFRELPTIGAEMLVLVDEYGGVTGIVSVRQLVEELIGHFDELESPDEKDYEVLENQEITLRGDMRVPEANEELQLGIPAGPYETVAGFLLANQGTVLAAGSKLVSGEFEYEVESVSGVRITRIVARKIQPVSDPATETAE